MRIVIAGAGIGGLVAALCLHKDGHEVVICEQSAQLSEIGAGIQLGANALQVLDYLGLLPQLAELAVAPKSVLFRDFSSGKILHRLDLGDNYQSEYGKPYWHVLRRDVQQVLLEAIKNTTIDIRYDSQVIEYNDNKESIEVVLSKKSNLNADLLIGADGIRSKVRLHLTSKDNTRFTRNAAWRALVPIDRLPDNWMDLVACNFVGPGKHAVVYYVGGGSLVNFVGVVENRGWRESSWVSKGDWHELKNDFAGWHPKVSQIIDAIPKDECYRWALYDLAPLKNWNGTRVTLLGDAAHATLPFMASGAALAIEDGRILQRALAQAHSLQSALQLYQSHRLPRTSQIQRSSAQLGKFYHVKNTMLRQAAFAGIRVLGTKRARLLPSYNANSVDLGT